MFRLAIRSVNRVLSASTKPVFNSAQRFYGKTHFWMTKWRSAAGWILNNNVFNHFVAVTAPKRFYKNVGILSCDGKYEITLDNRKLKTPSGTVFQVPNESLAIASMYCYLNGVAFAWIFNENLSEFSVAAEWDSQKEIIDRSKMHLVWKLFSKFDFVHKNDSICH